jgi:ABC-type uncharacterized transport system substrate-binding protein
MTLTGIAYAMSPVASAHPHVWVNYRLEFIFNAGRLTALHQRWIFDTNFSSMVLHHLVKNYRRGEPLTPQETVALRDNAFANLARYAYFTHVWSGTHKANIGKARSFTAKVVGDALEYDFVTPLATPLDPHAQSITVGIWDDSYYVDVGPTMPVNAAVSLSGISGCRALTAKDHTHPLYFGAAFPYTVRISCS